ncbi:hypothetical protein AB0I77_34665 [Streptomyces sp. NPDC050619]|uniref:hypothetical protein n=1 Tax=Streptomyces sp. NPDC050619 TaxID=3157214 RepID=UPI0034140DE7
MSWIAGAGAVVAMSVVTACSDDSTAQQAEPGSSSSSTAEAGTPTPTPTKGQTADQSTVQGAVAGWVTAIVQDRPKNACLVMGTPATSSSPARANTEATCSGSGSQAKKMEQQIHSLHASFAPESSTSDPKVTVAKVPVKGKTAVVPGKQVTIDGQTLTAIVLSHSTGVQKGDVGIKIEATDIDGSWYVTNLNLSVG